MTKMMSAIETEHVFDYEALLKPPVVIGAGPFGTRLFYEVREGTVSGPKVNGTVLTGGGDWALISGGETGFDDQYFRIAPEIETGDERYAWLTRSTFVGRGRVCRGPGVAYEVHRVC